MTAIGTGTAIYYFRERLGDASRRLALVYLRT
jgi:hypothetical protein